MTHTYTDCGAAPGDAGCGTCDTCVATAEADRAEGDGVLTAEQTAAVLTALRKRE